MALYAMLDIFLKEVVCRELTVVIGAQRPDFPARFSFDSCLECRERFPRLVLCK
jgi:hypothetical protein